MEKSQLLRLPLLHLHLLGEDRLALVAVDALQVARCRLQLLHLLLLDLQLTLQDLKDTHKITKR